MLAPMVKCDGAPRLGDAIQQDSVVPRGVRGPGRSRHAGRSHRRELFKVRGAVRQMDVTGVGQMGGVRLSCGTLNVARLPSCSVYILQILFT
jgi:hypothetical protein